MIAWLSRDLQVRAANPSSMNFLRLINKFELYTSKVLLLFSIEIADNAKNGWRGAFGLLSSFYHDPLHP